MGIIISCECRSLCNGNLKEQSSNNLNQIIMNSKEEYNNRNLESYNSQCSNINIPLLNNSNILDGSKNRRSSIIKSKFVKNSAINEQNVQMKKIKDNLDQSQTDNPIKRKTTYIGKDIMVSHEEMSKSISKIEKKFHLNLLESLKEIEENEKELNTRTQSKRYKTRAYKNNFNKQESKESNNNNTNEDELNLVEEDNIYRTSSVKNQKSTKFKSTKELMFAGLNVSEIYEIRGYFQLKKNSNYRYIGKKEIDGTKNGFGIIKWDDGSSLNTIFNNSKINNYGIFKDYSIDDELRIFYGTYIENIPKGYGYYVRDTKKLESDGWYKNNINGIGIEFHEEDCSFYKGEFRNSLRSGIGIYRYGDGTISYGEWNEGKLNGIGIIYYTNECIYFGEFENNIFHGFGEFLWKDGKYYIGEYQSGIKSGFGIFVWNFNKNDAYIGFWEDGKTHGVGVKIDDNHSKLCLWKEGRKLNNIKVWELDDHLKGNQSKYKKLFEKGTKFFIKFIHKLRNGDIFQEKL